MVGLKGQLFLMRNLQLGQNMEVLIHFSLQNVFNVVNSHFQAYPLYQTRPKVNELKLEKTYFDQANSTFCVRGENDQIEIIHKFALVAAFKPIGIRI